MTLKTIKKFKIKWDIEEVINLNWEFIEGYGVNEGFSQYTDSHYKNTLHNYKYFLPNPMPKFVDEIIKLPIFNKWKVVLPGFTLLKSGMVLPLHFDTYTKFKEMYNVTNINEISRFIIFLEDSKLGHMIELEDQVYKHWDSQDYVTIVGQQLHGAYNLGIENRYTLQVTCV